jgi:Na+/melibiose symporter-like transporter
MANPYWVVYATEVMGISELYWGTILTIATVIQVTFSFPAGSIIDRFEKRKIAATAS